MADPLTHTVYTQKNKQSEAKPPSQVSNPSTCIVSSRNKFAETERKPRVPIPLPTNPDQNSFNAEYGLLTGRHFCSHRLLQ